MSKAGKSPGWVFRRDAVPELEDAERGVSGQRRILNKTSNARRRRRGGWRPLLLFAPLYHSFGGLRAKSHACIQQVLRGHGGSAMKMGLKEASYVDFNVLQWDLLKLAGADGSDLGFHSGELHR
ncbi:hypothetical protein F5Y19DRAFT_469964 [Xylariaceae sp. FL1651]|nr:hypothetical protein F5Y19DRAFT_469964 [Xylariaceae sp. FL1651]